MGAGLYCRTFSLIEQIDWVNWVRSNSRKNQGYYTLVEEVYDLVWEAASLHAILTSSTKDQAHVFDIACPR
jgi:hypothetical protein